MKTNNKNPKLSLLISSLILGLAALLIAPSTVLAAQAPVDLGTADPFAILSGTPNITDAGNISVITGNVGMSPASGAAIGLNCSQVDGTIYQVDSGGPICFVTDNPLLVLAKNDLTAAFTDAAGRTPVTTVPTELGGTTKVAGVYDSASTTFQITAGAGPLILNGQGNADAVFIFEMDADGTGLTVGPGSTVSLINGAQACNVFWRLDTATIDTTAVFKGNVLALNSITVANGANIVGRLLARNGNVTLINDTITRADCAIPDSTGGGGSSSGGGSVPGLPNTGVGPQQKSTTSWTIALPLATIAGLFSIYIARKKRIT